MNKNVITNITSITLVVIGYIFTNEYILQIGLFAFSCAITNWLAIYMLFEKVPFIYGSGVIPARFKEFKSGIKHLMIEQFFNKENIDNFFIKNATNIEKMDLTLIIEKLDYENLYQQLIDSLMQSSIGSMLSMIGGPSILNGIKEDFKEKIKNLLLNVQKDQDITKAIKEQININQPQAMFEQIDTIINKRLDELTPNMIKAIIQTMIRKHLDWLVVWGGVFGGLLGIVSCLVI